MDYSSQKKAPLLEALSAYIKQGFSAFHMPGHKSGRGVLHEWRDLMGHKAFSIDLTEVEGLDDLHHPTGPIRQAQGLAAELMGAQDAYFLTNGVSVGIHSIIMALCRAGDKIILPRHAHRSIYGALILSGAEPVYLQPHVHPYFGIPIGVGTQDVSTTLERHPDAKCLVMVHPTYHGFASDLSAIVKITAERGIKILADEAHGAHFKFAPGFPASALQCGASASVQGWHKTMGSLTQSAMLLVNDRDIDAADYLTILQSTSPSYLLMGSLDAARKQWAQEGTQIAGRILDLACEFREKISRVNGIVCLDQQNIASPILAGLDKTKLVLNSWDIGLNGFEFACELREKYHIQPEMAAYEGVTLMVTMGDNKEKLDHLLYALREIVARFCLKKVEKPLIWEYSVIPEMKMLPGEALKAVKRTMKIEHTQGEISGEFICPYPPGIPLVVPGEVISKEAVGIIKNMHRWGGHVQGPLDSTGKTLRVVA